MQTRSQKQATPIYTQVLSVRDRFPDETNAEHQKQRRKYGSMAHKLPILIRTSGLAQALSFVDTRPEPIQQELLSHLAVVVGLQRSELLRHSREDDLSAYMKLTQRVLDALLWYKRFAQSLINVESSEDDEAQPEKAE